MNIHESCRWLELHADGLTNGGIFYVQKAQMFILDLCDDSINDKNPITLILSPPTTGYPLTVLEVQS